MTSQKEKFYPPLRQKHFLGSKLIRRDLSVSEDLRESLTLEDVNPLKRKSELTRSSLIIHRDGLPYSCWYSCMSGLISYSTIMTAFFLAYDQPSGFMILIDQIVWLMFVLDAILEFFTDFKDEDENLVDNHHQIALTYLKGWFIFDLIPIIPLSEFGYPRLEYYFRMIRLLKVKRGLSLFDGGIIGPVILAISKPKIPAEKHRIGVYIRYLVNFIQIFAVLIFTTYVLGALFFWWAETTNDIANPWNKHFTDLFIMSDPTPMQEMVRSWYFLTTTLSTVGYGDYYATNMLEKIMLIGILLIGISQFSLVVAQFNGLVAEFDKMSAGDTKVDELLAWMSSIDAVQDHIPPGLRAKIINHFEYYWEHDRLRSLALTWWTASSSEDLTKLDDPYLSVLPSGHKDAILSHLFGDFGLKFAMFFKKNNSLRMDLTPHFQPRLYQPNQHLLKQGKRVEEIVFLVRGEVACGVEDGSGFKPVIFYSNTAIIGDAEAITQIPAVASYKVVGKAAAHAYVLPVKPVLMILKEKYQSIKDLFVVQHVGKLNFIQTTLRKYGSPEKPGVKLNPYTSITERLKKRGKTVPAEKIYTPEDIARIETELSQLKLSRVETQLQLQRFKSALISEILEQAV